MNARLGGYCVALQWWCVNDQLLVVVRLCFAVHGVQDGFEHKKLQQEKLMLQLDVEMSFGSWWERKKLKPLTMVRARSYRWMNVCVQFMGFGCFELSIECSGEWRIWIVDVCLGMNWYNVNTRLRKRWFNAQQMYVRNLQGGVAWIVRILVGLLSSNWWHYKLSQRWKQRGVWSKGRQWMRRSEFIKLAR